MELRADNIALTEPDVRPHFEARAGTYIRLLVKDSGQGISSELMEKIFDPFFTTKPPGKGTGLGLATTLAIVKGHGGFLTVSSQPGNGSCFQVYFPAAQHLPEEPEGDNTSPDLSGNAELIMVVDDEPCLRETLKALLESHGYQVITAADGCEAISLFTGHLDQVRLVITDLSMPCLDGTETIRALKKLDPALPFILASGRMEENKIRDLKHDTQLFCLEKPFTSHGLLGVIEVALHKRPPVS